MTTRQKLGTGASARPESRPLAGAAAFRAVAETHALEALQALVTLAKGAASESVRMSAANAILDRAYGRPPPGAKPVLEDEAELTFPLEVKWLESQSS